MTNDFRRYAEQQADLQEHEAWKAGRRPLPHEPRDPRFRATYGNGYVFDTDLETGEESPVWRVDYEEAERMAWQRRQEEYRS